MPFLTGNEKEHLIRYESESHILAMTALFFSITVLGSKNEYIFIYVCVCVSAFTHFLSMQVTNNAVLSRESQSYLLYQPMPS